jgi:hypothetical protein
MNVVWHHAGGVKRITLAIKVTNRAQASRGEVRLAENATTGSLIQVAVDFLGKQPSHLFAELGVGTAGGFATKKVAPLLSVSS